MQPENKGFFKSIQQLVEEYVNERLLLLKLQTAEKTAVLVSLIFAALILGMLSFFILLFLSLMAGVYFAALTGNMYYGLGIVAAFYVVLLSLAVYYRRKWLIRYFSNLVVRLLFENTDITNGKQQ